VGVGDGDGLLRRGIGDAIEERRGVFVTAVKPLQVEHAEAAEVAEHGG